MVSICKVNHIGVVIKDENIGRAESINVGFIYSRPLKFNILVYRLIFVQRHILIEHWLNFLHEVILFEQEHHTIFRIKQLIKHKTENQFELSLQTRS